MSFLARLAPCAADLTPADLAARGAGEAKVAAGLFADGAQVDSDTSTPMFDLCMHLLYGAGTADQFVRGLTRRSPADSRALMARLTVDAAIQRFSDCDCETLAELMEAAFETADWEMWTASRRVGGA